MKKLFAVFAAVLLCSLCFGDGMRFKLDGNAHIFSYNDLKTLHESKSTIHSYSANGLYRAYDRLRESCGNNELLFEQKKETAFAHAVIVLSGYVSQVRKSFFNEYIVELETTESLADIGVVYPEKISAAMLSDLMNLKRGDYFEAIVITRSTYLYVDVPVWNQNGVYRTEP